MCASLARAARGYAQVVAATGVFGHTGPDGSTPFTRAIASGYAVYSVGENVAGYQKIVKGVMGAWNPSGSHYASIIYPAVTHAGFGRAVLADGGVVFVQLFGYGGNCA